MHKVVYSLIYEQNIALHQHAYHRNYIYESSLYITIAR